MVGFVQSRHGMNFLRMTFVVASLGLVGAVTGCSGGGTTPATDDSAALSSPPQGLIPMQFRNDFKASTIAMLDKTLYVGLVNENGEIVYVDPVTMKPKKSYLAKWPDLTPSDMGMLVDGHDLVLFGLVTDGDYPPNQADSSESFVISWFNPATQKVDKSIRIAKDGATDIPNTGIVMTGGKIYVASSDDGLRKLFSFDVPSAEHTELNQDRKLMNNGITLSAGTHGLAVEANTAFVGVASGNGGYLERIDLESGKKTKFAEEVGYPVSLVASDGKLIASNLDGKLFWIDAQSGSIEKTVDAGDQVDGLSTDGKYVYGTTRSGIYVTKFAQ